MEKYAAEELNSTLGEFFAELRKANGDDYEPDSLRVMFSAIDRHLKSKSYPKSIREDNRELKQPDAAAERRRSTSKFLFRRTQGQVNSLGP